MVARLGRISLLVVFIVATLTGTIAAETLEVWLVDWNTDTQTFFEETLIPQFEALNPGVKVEIGWYKWSGYREKITAALVGGTAPDILQVGGQDTAWVSNNSVARPVTTYFNKWKRKDEIPAELISQNKSKGEVWSIPYLAAPRSLVYHRTLFEEAGLNPDQPPKTWNEMIDVTQKLVKRDADVVTQLGFEAPLGGTWNYGHWQLFLEQAGGRLLDENNEPAFVSPEGLKALNYYRELVRIQDLVEWRWKPGASFNFWNKNIVMAIENSGGIAKNIEKGIVTPDEIDVALPAGDKKVVTYGFSDPLVITTTSTKADLAWAFIEHALEPQNLSDYNQTLNYIPPLRSAWNTDYVRRSPFLMKFAAALPYSQTVPFITTYHLMRTPLGNILAKAVKGEESPENVLEEAATKWRELAEY